MLSIFSFIFVLGVLIFVHELGHFVVAKKSGIRVERFSLGYPPKMIGKKIGDTEYCISWIPFGGYVKLAGQADIGEAQETGAPWEFGSKPVRTRMAVIAAGPVMNLILAFLIFLGTALVLGVVTYPAVVGNIEEGSLAALAGLERGDEILSIQGQPVQDWEDVAHALSSLDQGPFSMEIRRKGRVERVSPQWKSGSEFGISPLVEARVGSVFKGSPAEQAGLEKGDVILEVDGEPVDWIRMTEKIRAHPGQPVMIAWRRGTEVRRAEIVPEVKQEMDVEGGKSNYGMIGIGLGIKRRRANPIEAFRIGVGGTYEVIRMTVHVVHGILKGEISSRALGGPVLIAQMAGESARLGIERLLMFMAALSVQLGILNILPVPVLDGGHLLFLALEGLFKKSPLSSRQMATIQWIGLALLILLMMYVTRNDILRWLQ